jgi:predicted GNAT superfamily acetyltransferase
MSGTMAPVRVRLIVDTNEPMRRAVKALASERGIDVSVLVNEALAEAFGEKLAEVRRLMIASGELDPDEHPPVRPSRKRGRPRSDD